MENPFKKYFSENKSGENDKKRDNTNKFKKFDYADDEDEIFDLDDLFSEFHGKSFNFHGFPPGVLKQFQEILEAMQDVDDDPQNTQRQKFFENKYEQFRQKSDKDLDGQLYAEQLDTMLKRISPEFVPKSSTKPTVQKKPKIAEEDKIMDIIHGTFKEVIVPVKPRKRQVQKVPASPHQFGGMPPFDLPSNAGTTWGRTVISIRKQDGSSETRKMERTSDGLTKTTITKTDSDGTSSTRTFTGEGQNAILKSAPAIAPPSGTDYEERNLKIFDGYKIPSLW